MSSQQDQTDQEKLLDEITKEAEDMVEHNLSSFYSRGVPLVDVWMALSFFAKMKYHEVSFTSPWTIIYLACLVVSFFTDMEMNMMFVTRQFRGRWMVAYLSTILRISAATALMLFFKTSKTVTVLVPFGLVLVLIIYLFRQMLGPGKKVPGLRWLDFKELLNQGFEVSALVVAPSVAGLSGKVLGYVKGSSNLTTAVAPECFLFYGAVSGLFVVLFCTVPPSLSSRAAIMRMAKVYLPSISYMALSFLVVAAVVAAEKILQEYVYLVCCPIVIFALLLYLCDAEGSSAGLPIKEPPARRRSLNDEMRDEAELSKYLFTAGISPILLAIMAIHSSYGGTGTAVPVGLSWKAFVCSAVCCILSHTVRIVILAQMTEVSRYEISSKFWTAWTSATIITTAVCAVFVIWLHPDEVKSIF